MSRGEEHETSGPGWLVTLLGASVLLIAGFAVGVVVGAVREEPGLILHHLSGGTQSVAPAQPASPASAPVPTPPAGSPVQPAPPAASQPSAPPEPTAASSHVATGVTPATRAAAGKVEAMAPERSGREAGVAAPARPASPPAVASQPPAAGGRFFIQVGAFADSAQAEKLAGDLRKKGFVVAIAPGTGDRASRWRVRVGPLVSREEAGRVAEKLRSREKLPTWTLDESH